MQTFEIVKLNTVEFNPESIIKWENQCLHLEKILFSATISREQIQACRLFFCKQYESRVNQLRLLEQDFSNEICEIVYPLYQSILNGIKLNSLGTYYYIFLRLLRCSNKLTFASPIFQFFALNCFYRNYHYTNIDRGVWIMAFLLSDPNIDYLNTYLDCVPQKMTWAVLLKNTSTDVQSFEYQRHFFQTLRLTTTPVKAQDCYKFFDQVKNKLLNDDTVNHRKRYRVATGQIKKENICMATMVPPNIVPAIALVHRNDQHSVAIDLVIQKIRHELETNPDLSVSLFNEATLVTHMPSINAISQKIQQQITGLI